MEMVLFGEYGVVVVMKLGGVVIVSVIVVFEFVVVFGVCIEVVGLQMFDVFVLGGVVCVVFGEMMMMMLGLVVVYVGCEDVFVVIVGKVYCLGDVYGIGLKVKIINQLLVGVYIVVVVEVMVLGLCEGVDVDVLYDVIMYSVGNLWMFENCVLYILNGDYMLLLVVDIFVKDFGFVFDIVCCSKFLLLLLVIVYQMFMSVLSVGYGGEDDFVVIKIFFGIMLLFVC